MPFETHYEVADVTMLSEFFDTLGKGDVVRAKLASFSTPLWTVVRSRVLALARRQIDVRCLFAQQGDANEIETVENLFCQAYGDDSNQVLRLRKLQGRRIMRTAETITLSNRYLWSGDTLTNGEGTCTGKLIADPETVHMAAMSIEAGRLNSRPIREADSRPWWSFAIQPASTAMFGRGA